MLCPKRHFLLHQMFSLMSTLNKPYIYGGDYLSMRLFKFGTLHLIKCKLEHLFREFKNCKKWAPAYKHY